MAKKKNNLLSKEEHESRSRFKKTSISTNKSRIKWSSMNKSKRRQHKKWEKDFIYLYIISHLNLMFGHGRNYMETKRQA